MASETDKAAGDVRRLFVYNGGFLTQRRVRRILELSGYQIKLGAPSEGDMVGVWGQSPTSSRGETVAEMRDAPVLRVEDAFLRSVHPGREGSDPIGLHLDARGVHFAPSPPSDLGHLLATHPLDDTALLDRARAGIRSVARRFAMVRRVRQSLEYNDEDGAKASVDIGVERSVEKRA